MKAVVCDSDVCQTQARATLKARDYLKRQVAQLPNGDPYLCGVPSSFPFALKCAACRRRTTYSALRYAQLPNLSVEQLRALGQLEPLLRDWRGAGLGTSQAEDLIEARIMGPGSPMPLAPPPRQKPAPAPRRGRRGLTAARR